MIEKQRKIVEQKDSIVQEFINCFHKRRQPLVEALAKQGLFGLHTMRNYIIVTSIKRLQFKMNYTYSMSIRDQSKKYKITPRRIRKIYEENKRFEILGNNSNKLF